MIAAPNDPERCRLTVMVQNYTRANYEFMIPGGAFVPPPKVGSFTEAGFCFIKAKFWSATFEFMIPGGAFVAPPKVGDTKKAEI